jgi:hypothetical protein
MPVPPPLPAPQEGQAPAAFRKAPAWAWVVAFMFTFAGAFIVLRWARVIGTATMIVGILAALTAQIGMVSVLGVTNREPLQVFLVLLMGTCLFILGMWVFLLGQRVGYWSASALVIWRIFGKVLGGFLLIALILNIASFHGVRWKTKRWQEQQQQRQRSS